MKPELLAKIQELQEKQSAYALVTFVSARGHAPQEVGAKMLVSNNGLEFGTIGGGKLEAAALKYCTTKLQEKTLPCEFLTWNLQKDIGMSCGGEVSLLFEFFPCSPWNIAVFGAGHVSQALCRTLLSLQCSVQVFDSRKEWLEKLPVSPKVKIQHKENLADEVKNLADNTFLVVMTQGHSTDLPILEAAFRTKIFPYMGVLGSDLKSKKIRKELRELGIEENRIEQLHCPMGLELGTNAPEEIAISITAELLQERDRS